MTVALDVLANFCLNLNVGISRLCAECKSIEESKITLGFEKIADLRNLELFCLECGGNTGEVNCTGNVSGVGMNVIADLLAVVNYVLNL